MDEYSGSVEIKLTSGSLSKLVEVCEGAPVDAKAALTCLGCGTAEDFMGHPTVKEAMIQIDQFRSAHGECSRKGKHDEHEQDGSRGTQGL